MREAPSPLPSLTRIKADVGGGTGCQEGHGERPAKGLFIIEDLKLIHMSVAKELTSYRVLVPGQKTAVTVSCVWGGGGRFWGDPTLFLQSVGISSLVGAAGTARWPGKSPSLTFRPLTPPFPLSPLLPPTWLQFCNNSSSSFSDSALGEYGQ